jgi:hypothetical protein
MRSQRIEHIESELLLCEHELCCLQRCVGLGSNLGAADVAVDWDTMKDFMNSIRSCVQKGILSRLFGSRKFSDKIKDDVGEAEFKKLCDGLGWFRFGGDMMGTCIEIYFNEPARIPGVWRGDRNKIRLERDGGGVKWEWSSSTNMGDGEENGWGLKESGIIGSTADLVPFFKLWMGRVDNGTAIYEMLIRVYFR